MRFDDMMPRTRRSSLNSRAQARAAARPAGRAARGPPCPGRSRRSTACAARDRSSRARRAARAWPGLAVDHHRDVALRGALRDGAHVDAGAAQRAEHLAGHAGRAGHAVADHGEDRQIRGRPRRSGSGLRPARARTPRAPRAAARSACAAGIAQQIECSELPCEIRITEMPSSRSAPNRRCAVPGTPIMPAPSMLTSAMFSMVVMPLTGSSEVGRARRSACRDCPARRCCGSRSGCRGRRPAPWSADG